ncbi:MAG: helix-turn-helix transcriptional regulator [Chloroflexi bacterium]|nr:helix-turn-helix transcriptional regulator [Deltaproteobacteria bacterium]MBT4511324.1 helix-turn-helix transcriptional regulator [Chloroflexota bacterium]
MLQAAEQLFGGKGYQGVSIEEIARTAEVSKGLVIYHFGNKEELLVQVLRQGTAVLFTQLDTAIRNHETAKDKIRAAVEMYLSVASA